MARNVKFSFLRGGGSSLEVLYGKVSLTPTNLHTLSSTAVLPAPTTFDLINGTALATNVAPTPAPVDGTIAWAYKVKITDNFGKSWEYLVGVPDGTTEINFNVLPRYSETRPPAYGVGPAGPAGQSATIAIGTTTSGPTPAVTNSGTPTDAVLDFTLPKGDKGDTGAGVPAGGSALQVVRKNSGNTATEWATLDKTIVGLGNVDNTADVDKPLSTPQQTYVDDLWANLDASVKVFAETGTSALGAYLDETFTPQNTLAVDVKTFGAVGDGVTNDQLAVEAAVLAATGTFGQGGKVLFTPGAYTWQIPIKLPSNIVVAGVGASLVKKTSGGYAAFFTLLGGTVQGYGAGGKNIRFEGLRVEGDFSIPRQTSLLAAHHGQDIVVEDCVFSQCQVYGHVFDLQGCKGITFRRCVFEGQLTNSSYAYIECIQMDNSSLTGASYPDELAGYDGLPTIDLTIENCQFLPLTIGGVTHPAPNPVGSHSGIEGMYFSGLKFLRNIVYAGQAQTAGTHRGIIHAVSLVDSVFEGNLFINSTGVAVSAIALRPQTTGFKLSDVTNSGATTSTWTTPQAVRNIRIADNKFVGFNSRLLTEPVVSVVGHDTRYAEDVTTTGSIYENCYGGTTTENVSGDLLHLQYVRTTRVRDQKSDKSRRAVNFLNCDGLIIDGLTAKDASGGGSGPISGVESSNVTVDNTSIDGWRNFGVYLDACTVVNVDRTTTRNALAGMAITVNIKGCSRFSVDRTTATNGTRGVVVFGVSSGGQVRNTLASVSDAPAVISADSPTVTQLNNIAV